VSLCAPLYPARICLGYRYFEGEGRDPGEEWQPERSLLILEINMENTKSLSREYEQNSFIIVESGEALVLIVNPILGKSTQEKAI
jgi:hypothetical protein